MGRQSVANKPIHAPLLLNFSGRPPRRSCTYLPSEELKLRSHCIDDSYGQIWGETNSEARRAVSKLKRDFKIKPFSKLESKVEMSCRCLSNVLEEVPKQNVMWYGADGGAPRFEEGCEMNSERLTVLMDAATDRLRYISPPGSAGLMTVTSRRIIRWDLRSMRDGLAGNADAENIDDQVEK